MFHTMCAICHDSEGFVFIGYGNCAESAYNDLIAANEDESINPQDVVFYTRTDIKIRFKFE